MAVEVWTTIIDRLPCSRREYIEMLPQTGATFETFYDARLIVSTFSASKVHEEDVRREIQTANVNLPPEIVQVFAQSQIFYDHKPMKALASPQSPATFSIGAVKIEKNIERSKLEQISEEDSNKLLQRLEQQGNGDSLDILE